MSQGAKGHRKARILTTIEERYSTNDHGPREKEEVGRQHNHKREARAEILKYVVTIRRNNVLWIASS
jgi:hypothetical protein